MFLFCDNDVVVNLVLPDDPMRLSMQIGDS